MISDCQRFTAMLRVLEMKDAVIDVASSCLSAVLRDEAWQGFGFAKRPAHGAFFQRLRPRWKIELEKRVLQEMLASLTAAHILENCISSEDVPGVIDAYTSRPGAVAALGYTSPEEGSRQLTQSITEYQNTPLAEWQILLFQRIDAASIPNRKLSARLLLGCVLLTRNMHSIIQGTNQSASIFAA